MFVSFVIFDQQHRLQKMTNMENVFIMRIRQNDSSALDELFDSYYEKLCNYAYSIIRDYTDAEDIVQDLFVAIWLRRHSLVINSSVKAYLFRCVYNACLDYRKHEKVKLKFELQGKATIESCEFQQSIDDYDLSEKIEQAIEKLPEKMREIFCLSRFEQLTYAEIAMKLDISVNTVDTQIRRALKNLKKQLNEYIISLFVIFFGEK